MDAEKPKQQRLKARPEYLTVEECRIICRFKTASAIRKAVYRGDIQATRVRANKLLIKASSFWAWFHRNDVKPPVIVEVDLREHPPKDKPEPRSEEEIEDALLTEARLGGRYAR